MRYRKDKHGEDISLLGYGCMRFTKNGRSIDLDKAEKEIMAAYKAGVNYYDTAYIYPGSEVALGEILKRNGIREKVKIATKLPQYYISSRKAIDKYFDEQLERLQTDYIDYYLMHMLTDVVAWDNLKKNGILEWIEDKKASGQIRNIGFSYHGDTAKFIEILNDYDWEFCQIQYNYLDEHTQAGRKGLDAAYEKGIPVIIMEPLRGGKLVDLMPDAGKKLIASNERGWTAAEWAFRWLMQQPAVTCVLSGMNSVAMVEENCRIASNVSDNEFTEADYELIAKVKASMEEKTKVGCTACAYCMPCPKGVDIPGIFRCYNHMYTESKSEGRFEYAQTVALTKEPTFASQCIECGKCEKHCPQHIPIREKLKEADKKLRPLPYKIGINIARKYVLNKKHKK
ncbi:MAG: aldo/keto reductase [Lachnospiraceae bacterium]|nr:aldo/keto reductase [Lachnospiraceae bacterium]